MKPIIILSIFFAILLAGCPLLPEEQPPLADAQEQVVAPLSSLKIASWNLQIFGDTKAQDQELMQFYNQTIHDYDIIILQEIRDIDGSAFKQLCDMTHGYTCYASNRAGTTSSKEQYGVLFKSHIYIEFKDYTPELQDQFERPPLKLTVYQGSPFDIYTIHIKPDNVMAELANLEAITGQSPALIMGDLNADCAYYDSDINTEFTGWDWAIQEDTTSGTTNCAYDRIIANPGMSARIVEAAVFSNGINPKISDHYLVWAGVN